MRHKNNPVTFTVAECEAILFCMDNFLRYSSDADKKSFFGSGRVVAAAERARGKVLRIEVNHLGRGKHAR